MRTADPGLRHPGSSPGRGRGCTSASGHSQPGAPHPSSPSPHQGLGHTGEPLAHDTWTPRHVGAPLLPGHQGGTRAPGRCSAHVHTHSPRAEGAWPTRLDLALSCFALEAPARGSRSGCRTRQHIRPPRLALHLLTAPPGSAGPPKPPPHPPTRSFPKGSLACWLAGFFYCFSFFFLFACFCFYF